MCFGAGGLHRHNEMYSQALSIVVHPGFHQSKQLDIDFISIQTKKTHSMKYLQRGNWANPKACGSFLEPTSFHPLKKLMCKVMH